MTKMILNIPDELNNRVTIYLGYCGLDARDKSRLILAMLEQQLKLDPPVGLIDACLAAKEGIRERQKKRYQESMQP